jgi:hypothetical protein
MLKWQPGDDERGWFIDVLPGRTDDSFHVACKWIRPINECDCGPTYAKDLTEKLMRHGPGILYCCMQFCSVQGSLIAGHVEMRCVCGVARDLRHQRTKLTSSPDASPLIRFELSMILAQSLHCKVNRLSCDLQHEPAANDAGRLWEDSRRTPLGTSADTPPTPSTTTKFDQRNHNRSSFSLSDALPSLPSRMQRFRAR